jgi:hypothetical protein
VCKKLKQKAKSSNSEKEDFKAMGESVEKFAFHLLDPLKKEKLKRSKDLKTKGNEEKISKFKGQDFDRIIDMAVNGGQKKVQLFID